MAESLAHYRQVVEGFINREVILRTLRQEMPKAVPQVRKAIRSRALDSLPKGGGLNKWAAAIQIRSNVDIYGRTVHIKLRGGRNSLKNKSDINRLDAGTVRHPSWGRRGRGQWHVTAVTPGFFSDPVAESDEWSKAADRALDKALEEIR